MMHRSHVMTQPRSQQGVTLTELLVAIAIALILMAAVYSVYFSSKTAYTVNDSLARVQENMRFATDLMERDIRMAGYSGCKGTSVTNALNPFAGWTTDFTAPIKGFEAGVSTFTDFPAVGTAKGDRVAGTDAIGILRSSSTGFKIESHNPSSAVIKIDTTNHGIYPNDILMVSDCRHASIIQVTNSNQANATITHNTGTGSIGNCWKKIGPVTATPPPCGANQGTNYQYGSDAFVFRYIAHGYYIGVSQSGITKSLYMIDMKQGITSAQELVEGVVNMQLLYGEDTDADGLANHYVTADLANFTNVVSVRLGLLVESIDEPRTSNSLNNTYSLADTTITVTADKKLRYSFNNTIKIRNRGM